MSIFAKMKPGAKMMVYAGPKAFRLLLISQVEVETL